MGGRLTTLPSSASSSTAAVHRAGTSNTSTGSNHPRTHSNSTNHHYDQQSSSHRHRSNSSHHPHGSFGNNSTNNNRHRATSTNIDPLGTAPFNFNLLRYVGFDRESDDQSSDDDSSPSRHHHLPHFIIALRDVPCPVCNKTVPSDLFEKHILQCLSKPRIDYNGLSIITLVIKFTNDRYFHLSRGYINPRQRRMRHLP